MCTHNLVEAQKLCDRVAVLEHGRLVALGTPAELTRQYVHRLDVEIEVAEEQVPTTLSVLTQLTRAWCSVNQHKPNGALVVAINQQNPFRSADLPGAEPYPGVTGWRPRKPTWNRCTLRSMRSRKVCDELSALFAIVRKI